MGTFFKTFFACLILALSFLMYKFFGVDGYSSDLTVSKNNPVFGVHKDVEPISKQTKPQAPALNEQQNPEQPQKVENKASTNSKNTKEKYIHKCYFYSKSGKLEIVERELTTKPSVEKSVLILLKGPMIAETKRGIYSEIPANVDLIDVRKDETNLVVNLSSNFGNGGGTKSIENRINQLSKTIKILEPDKKIYLYINGKEIEYLGGDGVFVKQPLD